MGYSISHETAMRDDKNRRDGLGCQWGRCHTRASIVFVVVEGAESEGAPGEVRSSVYCVRHATEMARVENHYGYLSSNLRETSVAVGRVLMGEHGDDARRRFYHQAIEAGLIETDTPVTYYERPTLLGVEASW